METLRLETPLRRAKSHGSSKKGTTHWWAQRVSAILLIPLMLWGVLVIGKGTLAASYYAQLFESPFHVTAMIAFILLSCYHGHLGMQVIIEDYIQCSFYKMALLIGLQFLSGSTVIVGIVSILFFT